MARSFNGSSDFITIGAGFTLPATNSIFVWVYPTSFSANNEIVGGATTNGFELDLNGTGATNLIQTGTSGLVISTTNPCTTNTWNSLSTDFTPDTAHMYRNGVTQTPNHQANWSGTPANVFIGKHTGGLFFTGRIANVAIWNVVLTLGEHLALHAGFLPYQIRPTALIGYWPLNGLQSPEPDLSGSVHNGTLTGTALVSGPPATMLTPRWPQTTEVGAGPPATGAVYRRTLSPIGTRAGTRQVEL